MKDQKKRCKKCTKEKPLSDFYTAKGSYYKKNGEIKNYSSTYSTCKTCHSKNIGRYRKKNEDHYIEYRLKYEADNKERLKNYRSEYGRKRYAEKREQILERQRITNKKWRKRNRKKILDQGRIYRAKNRERVKVYQTNWYLNNRDRLKTKRELLKQQTIK